MMILIFAGALFVCGVGLLVRAIRGRVVSVHPHCRGCKFDLHGLTLSRESVCPECGRAVIPGTATVMDGCRVFRRRLAVVAVLLMLVGGGGLAWPSVSRMPAIKNMDWYAKFPEGLLVWLEDRGDKEALQALHDRLIPGTLSDEGLQQLISRSLAMADDESVVWDERWGDVLLYAFLEDRFNPPDLEAYLEGAISLSVEMDTTIDTFDTYAEYIVSASFSKRFEWSKKFWKQWHSVPQYRANPVRVTITDSVVRAKSPQYVYKMGDLSKQVLWDSKYISKYILEAHLPLAHDKDNVSVAIMQEIRVELGGALAHSWTVQEEFVIRRQSNGRTREQAILDSMAMERVNVYTQLDQAKLHGLDYLQNMPIAVQMSNAQQYSLHGNVFFRIGDTELYFGEVHWDIEENLSKNIHIPNLSYPGEDPIGYYQDNQPFWDKALSTGEVDVIIRPLKGADSKPSFTNRAFAFQGLAVERYIPTDTPKLDSRGNSTSWVWDPINRFPGYPLRYPVNARFLDDD
jgi:predicted RNA-binding Zn-ribbon protein involved in translation (DUF1610 family)